MSPGSRTRWPRLLEVVAGVAAGIAGFSGLGVYLFAPRIPRLFCYGALGPCPYRYLRFVHTQLAEQVVAATLLWVLPFLAVAVGAFWDGIRTSLAGRVVLWVGTVEVVVATAVGLFFGAFVMFVPGALLALAASGVAGAYRR